MNVLIITFDPPNRTGGIENRSRLYLKGLRKNGHHAKILSFLPFSENLFHTNTDDNQFTLPSSPAFMPLAFITLLRMYRRERFHSILMLTGCLTFVGVSLLLYARLLRIKSTALLYGKDVLSAMRISSLEHFILPLATRLANRVAVNSKFTASLLGDKIKEKAVVLYPCIDPNELQIQSSKSNSSRRIVFAGRLIRRKGVDDLLRAFSFVSTKFPDCFLDIIGDGPELINLKNLAKQLSIDDKVIFHGELRGKKLYGDVEGFGTVILEAAFYSIPAVGTYSGGIREAIIDGVTGRLVPESNPVELGKAIYEYLLNPEIIKLHGEAARQRVLSQFTLSQSVKQIISTFK